VISWWRRHLRDSRHLVPVEDVDRPVRRRLVVLRTAAVLAVFDLNDRLIRRFGGDLPAVRDPRALAWTSDVEAAHALIGAEIERYLVRRDAPHVAEIAGLTPGSEEALLSAPVDRGEWRTLVLVANGHRIEETAQHFPDTMRALAACPHMTTVGFSTLAGHSHIGRHADPNRGALRFQLPLVVPGAPGDCRIRVGEQTIDWEEGRSVLFDVAALHEVWNDADGVRVLLLVETLMPLRPPLSSVNRFAQCCSGSTLPTRRWPRG
jgi:hypothetical protein